MKFEEHAKVWADLPVKSGDIVIYAPFQSVPNSAEFSTINLTLATRRPRDYEVYFDSDHFTPDGYRLIAEEIFKGLMDLGLLQKDHAVSGDCSGNDLRSTGILSEYLRLLKKYAQKYCVLVSLWDAPSRPGFTKEISELYRTIGFQDDLLEKPHCAYAAAIDDGELVYEELCEDAGQDIDVTLTDEDFGFQATIVSRRYGSKQSGRSPIEINEISYSLNRRGLHLVVYDNAEHVAIDAVNFDVSLDLVSCYHYLEWV